MRDINRAERLLSLFTSSDAAAGIVGDLSEERTQHGSLWFWRQVLGTVLSLCRGALFESPVIVLLLVALGFVVYEAVALAPVWPLLTQSHPDRASRLIIFVALPLAGWLAKLIAGAVMVAVAPRVGMAACTLLAGIQAALSVVFAVLWFDRTYPYSTHSLWWLGQVVHLAAPLLLLVGGAIVRRRWSARTQRSAA